MKRMNIAVKSKNIECIEFEVQDDFPESISHFFIDWLNRWLEEAHHIQDGHIVPFGFSLFKTLLKERVLILQGPDFNNLPIIWMNDLTPSFKCLMDHKYIPESFDLPADIPNLLTTVVVGIDFNKQPMFINRSTPVDPKVNPDDSGWFFGSLQDSTGNNDAKNLRLISLYEAGLKAPHVLPFLSMPQESLVIFEKEIPVIIYQEKVLSPGVDSYYYKQIMPPGS